MVADYGSRMEPFLESHSIMEERQKQSLHMVCRFPNNSHSRNTRNTVYLPLFQNKIAWL